MPAKRRIPLSVDSFGPKERDAVAKVMRSGQYTQGRLVRRFEEAMLDGLGADRHMDAVMVNSGSSANLLAADLLAHAAKDMELRGPLEVIMPATTWSTTVAPFIQRGFKPVFVDVLDNWMHVDPARVAEAVGPRTAGIVAVHLLGWPCRMDMLAKVAERKGVPIIEDCCEALGASIDGKPVGTFGTSASFSFYQSHQLSTIEGGLFVYPKAFFEVRAWREHGWTRQYPEPTRRIHNRMFAGLDPRWTFDQLGYNLRSTEVNAAIGLVQLKRLGAVRDARLAVAEWFHEHLRHGSLRSGLSPDPRLPEQKVRPNPFSYPIVLNASCGFTRKELTDHLEGAGIETRPIMTGNITKHPWYYAHPRAWSAHDLTNTDDLHENGFLIPCRPGMDPADLQHVRDVFDRFLRKRTGEGLR